MSKPLQPGMLCVITGACKYFHSVGREVVLERYFPCPDSFVNPDTGENEWLASGDCWMVRAPHLLRPFVFGPDRDGSFCFVDPRYLMPIDGGEFTEIEEQQEETA